MTTIFKEGRIKLSEEFRQQGTRTTSNPEQRGGTATFDRVSANGRFVRQNETVIAFEQRIVKIAHF
jgi:hypothetical protein